METKRPKQQQKKKKNKDRKTDFAVVLLYKVKH